MCSWMTAGLGLLAGSAGLAVGVIVATFVWAVFKKPDSNTPGSNAWRESQAQGIDKAKRQGKYRGRRIDEALHQRIKELLENGYSIRKTADIAGTSPTTVQRVKTRYGVKTVNSDNEVAHDV